MARAEIPATPQSTQSTESTKPASQTEYESVVDRAEVYENDFDPLQEEQTENVDDVLGFLYDKQEVEQAKAKLQIPRGDYFKSEGHQWMKKITFNDEDKKPWDKSPEGRLRINIYGLVTDGRDVERFFGFYMSPDLRYHVGADGEVDENRYDNMHLTWWKAREYYLRMLEEEPKTGNDVVNFLLHNEDIVLSITEGRNGGNFLGGFKVPKRR